MIVKFLSYVIDEKTPTYGNRNTFRCDKKTNILNGDIANDSFIKTTVHIGTHIDMPYHFYENGQTIEDFSDEFWIFNRVAFVEIQPKKLIIEDELIKKIEMEKLSKDLELLIVKTGICNQREEKMFWDQNYGFSPELYNYFITKFPSLRVFGFDSISASSLTNESVGIEVHKKFLNPEKPVLLLEDMNLTEVSKNIKFNQVIIAPLRIKKCDGLPCTIIAFCDN